MIPDFLLLKLGQEDKLVCAGFEEQDTDFVQMTYAGLTRSTVDHIS